MPEITAKMPKIAQVQKMARYTRWIRPKLQSLLVVHKKKQ